MGPLAGHVKVWLSGSRWPCTLIHNSAFLQRSNVLNDLVKAIKALDGKKKVKSLTQLEVPVL